MRKGKFKYKIGRLYMYLIKTFYYVVLSLLNHNRLSVATVSDGSDKLSGSKESACSRYSILSSGLFYFVVNYIGYVFLKLVIVNSVFS